MKADAFTVPWEATDEQLRFIAGLREQAAQLAQQEARAERDREWRTAVNQVDHNGLHTLRLRHCRAPACAPLRALLEGK